MSRPVPALGGKGRARVLMVCEDDLYPRVLGGMELRGRELAGLFERRYEVALYQRHRLTAASDSVPVANPEWSLAGVSGNLPRRLLSHCRLAARGASFMLAGRGKVRAWLARYRPDLVFFLKFGTLHPGALYELLAWPTPVVVRFGDCTSARLPAVIRGISPTVSLRRTIVPVPRPPRGVCDRMLLVFNCEFLRDFYLPLFPPVAHRIVYTGVDTQRFRPAQAPVDAPRFAFLGRTTRRKGFLDFCRAMSELPAALVRGIDVLGDGPDLDKGLALLRAGGRASRLGYVGRCPHEAVAERLRAASILVQPTDDDVLPSSVLEGMATGLGVVATAVAGLPEIVRDGETGLLVPPHDPGRLLSACRLLAEDAALRRRLGRNARRLVATRHTADAWRAANLAAVEDMLGRACAGAWPA